MFIDPFGFFNELDGRYYCCITGANRSGKDLISHAIAYRYLKQGYKFLSNKRSPWNDDWLFDASFDEMIDSNYQMNLVINFSEGGWSFRTMETYKEFLITIGMLNNRLLIPSRTLPHEDMQQFLLYPKTPYNPYIQLWLFQIWDFANERPKIRPLLFLFPYRYFGTFTSGGYPRSSTRLYSWIMGCNKAYAALSGGDATNQVSDLARPSAGLGGEQSSFSKRLTTIGLYKQGTTAQKKK